MKLVSWNVNGIRAIFKKDFAEDLKKLDADVICLQETKAQVVQVQEIVDQIGGYTLYGNEAEKKGYSGTAIITKTKPLSVTYDLGIEEHDKEGRVITAEYDNFYLITVYTPNSKSDLSRLKYRQQWDADFLVHLKNLEKQKPVVVCGDLNVAHKGIDLKNDKANYNKSAGFTQAEIDGLDNYVNADLVDTFRHFYPKEVKYSWWSYRFNCRANNTGWRIDYFLASKSLIPNIKDAHIYNDLFGSDHCPVGIEIE
jgi:exodeoxyribonuclease-3